MILTVSALFDVVDLVITGRASRSRMYDNCSPYIPFRYESPACSIPHVVPLPGE